MSVNTSNFIHLHCHSEYSLLDGSCRLNTMCNRAKELGMTAIALTDHGNMYGAVAFQKTALKFGLKPIIGCELYLAVRSMQDKSGHLDRKHKHLTLLVKNHVGYVNLCKLITEANLHGFYYRPRVDLDCLRQYSSGLIALSGCAGGEIPRLLNDNKYDEAYQAALNYQSIFGEDFYLEIMSHGLPEEDNIRDALIRLSTETNISLVATNDVHYVYPEDVKMHEILLCIQTNAKLHDPDRMRFSTDQVYLKSSEEMASLFSDIPQALSNTQKIADQCNFQIPLGQTLLPHFPLPEGTTARQYLHDLCYEKLDQCYTHNTEEIMLRLHLELEVISNMGFSDYFLIVQDFINYAKEQGIPVGPGRGSVAGSIVAYILGITAIDPLRYGLLFERFLNPERISMPDIDIDFCINRRQEVIDYVSHKYGSDRVAQIITFGTMAAKAAIRDVGRVYDIPLNEVMQISKLIPNTVGITIEEAVKQSTDLQAFISNHPNIGEVIIMSQKLEGFARHAGTHAAGIIISKAPLTDYVPLQLNEGQVVCQYPMEDLEAIGLLKMDFLGLRNLTIIDNALKSIKHSQGTSLDLKKIPLDDHATFKLLQTGETGGVFQLESRGMRALIKNLQPSSFEDIIALLALYRPGPLGSGMVQEFIDNKHQRRQVSYLLPDLKPILQETYGLILYQEQVMKIASLLAGFSLGQADMLRRAMGKKKKEVMDKQKELFMQGALARNYPEKLADQIFDLMAKFAEYGFNKSHSAAYAVISYQTAYLKANYPLEFMASLLTSVSGNNDKVSQYIGDSQSMGIEILPPDINESLRDFTVSKGAIRFGLGSIKNVGSGAVEGIISERLANGEYNSFTEFCHRVDSRVVNKRVLDSLIKVGCFGSFAKRSQLISVMESILESVGSHQKQTSEGQRSLFDMLDDTDNTSGMDIYEDRVFPPMSEYPPKVLLKMEKELMGFYVSDHPLNHAKMFLSKEAQYQVADIPEQGTEEDTIRLAGILNNCRTITTKNGKKMATAILEDLTGSISVIIFPHKYEDNAIHFKDEEIVAITGKVNVKEDQLQLVVEKINPFTPGQENLRSLHINISQLEDASQLNKLKEVFATHRGIHPIFLHTKAGVLSPDATNYVSLSSLLREEIAVLVGQDNIWED